MSKETHTRDEYIKKLEFELTNAQEFIKHDYMSMKNHHEKLKKLKDKLDAIYEIVTRSYHQSRARSDYQEDFADIENIICETGPKL